VPLAATLSYAGLTLVSENKKGFKNIHFPAAKVWHVIAQIV
jgi:hypothetical protein